MPCRGVEGGEGVSPSIDDDTILFSFEAASRVEECFSNSSNVRGNIMRVNLDKCSLLRVNIVPSNLFFFFGSLYN